MKMINRLKTTSGMVEIVNASSHDFRRPPEFAQDPEENSSFHESNLINTPIEEQSLDNNTRRDNFIAIDNSPRLFEMIQ